MHRLRALWQGDIPLRDAFWTWAVGIGQAVNITTSLLFLAMIAQDRSWIALILGYGLSLPYNLLTTVGVWRSASRHSGSAAHAEMARAASLVLMALLSFT